MPLLRISFTVSDEADGDYDRVMEQISMMGGYDVDHEEIEEPKIRRHEAQPKPKAS